MKRITVWIYSKSDSAEQVSEKLREFLAQMGLRHMIVETCELVENGDNK